MRGERGQSRRTHLANHSFDILVISRSLGWTRSSQFNIAAGISERALGQSMESNKLVTRDHSVPGSRRVGMMTIKKRERGVRKIEG